MFELMPLEEVLFELGLIDGERKGIYLNRIRIQRQRGRRRVRMAEQVWRGKDFEGKRGEILLDRKSVV